jgi:hypothetical protein
VGVVKAVVEVVDVQVVAVAEAVERVVAVDPAAVVAPAAVVKAAVVRAVAGKAVAGKVVDRAAVVVDGPAADPAADLVVVAAAVERDRTVSKF